MEFMTFPVDFLTRRRAIAGKIAASTTEETFTVARGTGHIMHDSFGFFDFFSYPAYIFVGNKKEGDIALISGAGFNIFRTYAIVVVNAIPNRTGQHLNHYLPGTIHYRWQEF